MTEDRKRIAYIEYCRAIGVILMAAGHIGFGETYTLYIQSFHMPLFFLLSGFLYTRKSSFGAVLKRKARSLLQPYYLFGVLFLMVVAVGKPERLMEDIRVVFLYPTNHFPLSTAMWFLMALFLANIIYYAIDSLKHPAAIWCAAIAVGLLGELFHPITGILLPFALGPALVGVAMMQIGRSIRSAETPLCQMKVYQICILAPVGFAAALWEGYVSLRTDSYPHPLIFWLVAVANILVVINIAYRLERGLGSTKIGAALKRTGQNAIVYVIFNHIVIRLCFYPQAFTGLPWLATHAIVLLATVVILYIIGILFEKPGLRCLVGRT